MAVDELLMTVGIADGVVAAEEVGTTTGATELVVGTTTGATELVVGITTDELEDEGAAGPGLEIPNWVVY